MKINQPAFLILDEKDDGFVVMTVDFLLSFPFCLKADETEHGIDSSELV